MFGSVFWGLPSEFWQEHVRSESISWWHLLGVSRMPLDSLMKVTSVTYFEAIHPESQRGQVVTRWILLSVGQMEAGLSLSA